MGDGSKYAPDCVDPRTPFVAREVDCEGEEGVDAGGAGAEQGLDNVEAECECK